MSDNRRRHKTARTIVAEEYRRTEAEADAFATFSDRVAAIDDPQTRPDGGMLRPTAVQELDRSCDHAGCKSVCRAYRETILSMPHYEEEYDESLRENMSAEFSRDLAKTVFEAPHVTTPLKQALLHASSQSHDNRREFLRRLDTEAEVLEKTETTLREIDSFLNDWNARPLSDYSFTELQEIYEELESAEDRCERLARNRQHALHADEWMNMEESVTVQSYLYSNLEFTYPVLSDVATYYRFLQQAKSKVTNALATTP
jgi:DNA repair exonuclease SbcCD ATPase subunit